jgi:hypothetical protein
MLFRQSKRQTHITDRQTVGQNHCVFKFDYSVVVFDAQRRARHFTRHQFRHCGRTTLDEIVARTMIVDEASVALTARLVEAQALDAIARLADTGSLVHNKVIEVQTGTATHFVRASA